jgi:hypothetical protein
MKYELFLKKLEFLRYEVSTAGIYLSEKKTLVIKKIYTLKNNKKAHFFIYLTGYY